MLLTSYTLCYKRYDLYLTDILFELYLAKILKFHENYF